MNKKILNTIATATQKSNEQKQTKALIINLGIASQLTFGLGGSQVERCPRAFEPWT